MSYIRRFIYKLGIRPKAGSIFFSPSLHLLAIFAEDRERIREGWRP